MPPRVILCSEAGLSACVRALDKRWKINKRKYGFVSLEQKLQASPEFRKAGLANEDARRYLQCMIKKGMLIQKMAMGNAVAGKTRGTIYYNVSRDHPLVLLAHKGGDLSAKEELLPTAPAASDVTMLGEDHPQIKRFRERERKKAELRR